MQSRNGYKLIAEIREMARKRGLRVGREKIKAWINEGRR
jgi:hypothetical protein